MTKSTNKILRLGVIAGILFFMAQLHVGVISAADEPANRPGQEWAEKALQASLHGKNDEAISYADKVIRLKPDNAEDHAKAYFARGLARYNQGQKKEAISDLNWAVNFFPTFLDAYVVRGNAKSDLGMYDQAIEDQDRALKIKPDYARAFSDRGFAYYKKEMYDKAIADSTRSLELNPNDPNAFDTLGHVCFKKGDYDQAIQNYGKGLQINSRSGHRYMYRATAYLKKKMYDEALADCQKGAEFEPGLAGLYSLKGQAYAGKKEYDPAIQSFDTAIKLNPENASDHFDRGMALKEMGREQEGLADVQKAVAMSPKVEKFQKGLAEFGQPKKAAADKDIPSSDKEQTAPGIQFSRDENLRGANPPPARLDFSSMEESKHFKVFYDKDKWPTVGSKQDPVKFAREVGTYLDHAWDEYHKNEYPRPFEDECKAWDSIRTVPSSIPYPPRIDVTIDPRCIESETGTLSGKITLKFDYESKDQVRHDAAHEVFHTFQQSLFSSLSSLAQQGYVARHWWMEATADYVADKIALGGLGTMAKPNLEYFKAPMNTDDRIHDYATSRFIDYLVSQKGVVFKELWDASVANGSNNMVAFLENYLLKTTATTLHDHYKGFAEYTIFDASSPLELHESSTLSGVIMTSGFYKGGRQGGLVEADTPKDLAADKTEISYTFNLSGGYTAQLWGVKAPNKDPKSLRTLKIEATGNVPKASDVDANVYVLKNDKRPKGGVDSNPDLFKGTINSTRKSLNLSVASDEVVYILAFNTGAGDQSLTVRVKDASLTISPPTASVDTGKNVTFTTPGVTEKVLWTVQEGADGGAVSDAGVYTAPDKGGIFHVVATLDSDPSVAAPPATVTVATAITNDEVKYYSGAMTGGWRDEMPASDWGPAVTENVRFTQITLRASGENTNSGQNLVGEVRGVTESSTDQGSSSTPFTDVLGCRWVNGGGPKVGDVTCASGHNITLTGTINDGSFVGTWKTDEQGKSQTRASGTFKASRQ